MAPCIIGVLTDGSCARAIAAKTNFPLQQYEAEVAEYLRIKSSITDEKERNEFEAAYSLPRNQLTLEERKRCVFINIGSLSRGLNIYIDSDDDLNP